MTTFERLDLCRACGVGLEVKAVCAVCEQPEQIHCANCYHYVDDPVHAECSISGPDGHFIYAQGSVDTRA